MWLSRYLVLYCYSIWILGCCLLIVKFVGVEHDLVPSSTKKKWVKNLQYKKLKEFAQHFLNCFNFVNSNKVFHQLIYFYLLEIFLFLPISILDFFQYQFNYSRDYIYILLLSMYLNCNLKVKVHQRERKRGTVREKKTNRGKNSEIQNQTVGIIITTTRIFF